MLSSIASSPRSSSIAVPSASISAAGVAAAISPRSPNKFPQFSPSRGSPIRAQAAATSAPCMESRVATRIPQQSLYEVLGVQQQSDARDIRSAYRQLARLTHPDVAATENKEESTKEFLKIHAAYTTLSDPERRARYDLQLSVQGLPRLSSPRGFSGIGYDSYSFMANGSARSSPSPSPSPSPSSMSYSPSPSYSAWKQGRTWETDQCW